MHRFEDHEKTAFELKPLLLKILYNCLVASDCFYSSNLLEFLDLFVSSWFLVYVSLVYFSCMWFTPCALNEFVYLY